VSFFGSFARYNLFFADEYNYVSGIYL